MSAFLAWSADLPVKSVTGIGCRPLLTVTATAAPGLSDVPAAGSCATTVPAATVSLNSSLRSPSTRCWAVSVAEAASAGVPTSPGAAYRSWPLLTVRSTLDSLRTSAPAAGFAVMTVPAGALSSNTSVTDERRSARCSSAWAAAWVSRSSDGTRVIEPGPPVNHQAAPPPASPSTSRTARTAGQTRRRRRAVSGGEPGGVCEGSGSGAVCDTSGTTDVGATSPPSWVGTAAAASCALGVGRRSSSVVVIRARDRRTSAR